MCSACSDLSAQERHGIYACSPLGAVNVLCLHNFNSKRVIVETWEEILPLLQWEFCLRSATTASLGDFCGSAHSEVITHRKHLNALLKLITCLPELVLLLSRTSFSSVLNGLGLCVQCKWSGLLRLSTQQMCSG